MDPGKPISPWEWSARLKSPDGRHEAAIDDATEIAMGGPASGTLKMSNGKSYPGCSPSMVWSDDSRFLAVPTWTRDRSQRLMIVRVDGKEPLFAPGTYRVLERHRFAGGVVQGVDSPIHMPRELKVDVRALISSAGN
jgi:hypothetical protein